MTNTEKHIKPNNQMETVRYYGREIVVALPPSNWTVAKATGSKYFSTGHPCKKGHSTHRYASTGQCVECQLENGTKRDADPVEKARRNSMNNESNSYRRAERLGLVPHTYDRKACQEVYLLAKQMTEEDGVPYEVDHMTPLKRGGEHHHSNLMVVPDWMNNLKGTHTLEETLMKGFVYTMLDALKMAKRFEELHGLPLDEYLQQHTEDTEEVTIVDIDGAIFEGVEVPPLSVTYSSTDMDTEASDTIQTIVIELKAPAGGVETPHGLYTDDSSDNHRKADSGLQAA